MTAGFAFDPLAGEEASILGRLTILQARMNPDLAMGDELLKKTGSFVVFGEPDIEITSTDDGQLTIEIHGLDVYDPTTGQLRSSSVDDICAWFLDTDYDGDAFFVRHTYFTGADDPYDRLRKATKPGPPVNSAARLAKVILVSEEFVREVLLRRIAPLKALLGRQQQSVNPFLDAIDPDVAAGSSLTRALTSQMGGWLAGVARDLAVIRYGEAAVPPVLYSDTVTSRTTGAAPLNNDTVVITQLDQTATRDAAVRLLRAAVARPKDVRIGTDDFRQSFRETIAKLRRLPREAQPWSVQVDLFVDDPAIGFAELESGGNLDTSNVKSQPEKLVRAGLSYGDPDAPLHFCLAYANRGEGIRPQGGLPTYLATAGGTEPSAGLLVGSAWWSRLLPPDVSHSRFLELFGEVVREIQSKAV